MADRPQGPVGVGAGAVAPVPPVVLAPRGWGLPTAVGRFRRAFFILVLLLLSVLFVYPFLWLISASLKPQGEVFDNRLIPQNFQENFTEVLDRAPVATWFLNSVWISGLGALLVTFTSAMVAFAFAYFEFPGRTLLFAIVIATMMLPGDVTMIPTYLIWNEIGEITGETGRLAFMPDIGVNTQYPLWVPNLFGSAFYIFLQRQFFLGIPRQLFEAARIDGDSYWTMFWRIAVPLAKPALIVTFIFEIQAKWFELRTALIYLRDDALFTLPLGMKALLDRFGAGGGGEGEWHIIMAGTVILVVPMVIMFALFQRYFITGITTQGGKG